MTPSAPARPLISAVVHTRNEAHQIQACLATLTFADETVVVDNDSTDNTRELAQAAGARVVRFAGSYGYPEPARVFGLSQLRGTWVFILDADERVTPELAAAVRAAATDPTALDGYEIPIRNFHFGRWLKHGGLYPDLHLRFFQRDKGHYPEVGIHRGIRVTGPTGRLAGDILHYSYRDLDHYFDKFDRYTTAEAQRLIAQKRRPTGYDLILKPCHRWIKNYLFRAGWRDGLPGFLYHAFSAAYIFVSEAKVWEHFTRQGERLPMWSTLFKRKRVS